MKTPRFQDRSHAGQALAQELKTVLADDRTVPLVLALPRGGLPVAVEVAATLGAELDVLVVRKVGVPAHPELAMGALAMLAGTLETVRNDDVLAAIAGASEPGGAFDIVAKREAAELRRRDETYRLNRPPVRIAGRTVLLVDDGLATGASMRAALIAARRQAPGRLVAAVPVGAHGAIAALAGLADDVVTAWTGEDLGSVGQAYEEFLQTSDDEVRDILSSYEQPSG